jgi:hypothetical protein
MSLTYSAALRIEEFLAGYTITPEDEADARAAAKRLWDAGVPADGPAPAFTLADLAEYIGSPPCEPSECEACHARGVCCG